LDLKVNISEIIQGSFLDYPSKEDICLSLYFAGCDGICPQCQNKELQDPLYGKIFTLSELINIISIETKRYRTNKITLLGGDPLFYKNREFVKELLNRTYTKYDYCIYTGYDVEYVRYNRIENFKFLKTGRFDHTQKQQSLKTDDYFQLASKNQKIYNSDFKCLTQDGILYFN
jgi:anaerobic ribonucleoside-triphosphate reductase activating protein